MAGDRLNLLIRALSDKVVIFGMSTYPKPNDILICFNPKGSVFPADTHRMEPANFLEVQGRMLRVVL